MHFCRADIALGGDRNNIYTAGYYAPVSWPEILMLQYTHGDDAVDNVEPFVRVEQSPKDERRRLAEKYGEEAVIQIFARQPIHEMEAPRASLPKGLAWFSPITMKIEVTDNAPSEDITIEQSTDPDIVPQGVLTTDEGFVDEMERPMRKRAR